MSVARALTMALWRNHLVHAGDLNAPKSAQCPECGRPVALSESERGRVYRHADPSNIDGCSLQGGPMRKEER